MSDGNYFTHPYMQCAFMFVGEFSVWIAYGGKKFFYSRRVADNPTAAPMSPGAQTAN